MKGRAAVLLHEGWEVTHLIWRAPYLWKTYEMRGRGIFIRVELVSLCASSRKCDSIMEGGRWGGVGWCGVVGVLVGRCLQKGQRSQRTPWEGREDQAEEQDGTLLKQHSAEGDCYQDLLHNYLPNKGHFYITPTLACAPEMDYRYSESKPKVDCVKFGMTIFPD